MSEEEIKKLVFENAKFREVFMDFVTLRDKFAGQAMQSLITGRSWDHIPAAEIINAWAKYAYEVADAMILERAK